MFKQGSVVTPQCTVGNEQSKPMIMKNRGNLFPRNTVHTLWGQTNRINGADTTIVFPAESERPDPALGSVDGMLKHAIQDATQPCDLPLRWEALAWLWVCCPDVADQLDLPWPEAPDLSQKAANYLERFSTF